MMSGLEAGGTGSTEEAAAAAAAAAASGAGEEEGLPLLNHAGEGDSLAPEEFRSNVNSSWQLQFDGEGYFRDAFLHLKENSSTLFLAMAIWSVTLLVVEYFFWHAFGRLSVHHSHRLGHHGGIEYASSGDMVPFGDWRHHGRGHTGAWYALHVSVLYVHRTFLFYPAIASFYVAVFNSFRHPRGRIQLAHFFTCFHIDWLMRLWPVSSVLFAAAFFTTLHWFTVPLFGYLMVISLFAIPMMVDQPRMGTYDALMNSAIVANGHLVSITLFFIFCFMLQIIGLFLLVGVFFTFPLCHLAVCFMYHHLVGVANVKRDLAPMPIE